MWELYFTFVKIGAVMIGGGYSMLPLLLRELVDKKGWCTEEEILDYFSLAQCTPGVIAVNTATFVGYKQKKTLGGILATLGVITVPLLLILLIAAVLSNFMALPLVQHVFAGIRVAVAALMCVVIGRLVKKAASDKVSLIILIVSFVMLAFVGLNSVYLVLLAAVFGLVFGRWRKA